MRLTIVYRMISIDGMASTIIALCTSLDMWQKIIERPIASLGEMPFIIFFRKSRLDDIRRTVIFRVSQLEKTLKVIVVEGNKSVNSLLILLACISLFGYFLLLTPNGTASFEAARLTEDK